SLDWKETAGSCGIRWVLAYSHFRSFRIGNRRIDERSEEIDREEEGCSISFDPFSYEYSFRCMANVVEDEIDEN
ncbi:hypothetical protein PENTCL1PPCAC_26654, partial [Pristionchus entomophagus]